jgi:hypothetical protein
MDKQFGDKYSRIHNKNGPPGKRQAIFLKLKSA